jgi:hypothetical protein
MKTIILGDTHGREDWKEIVQQDFDKVIFIGDYFDSFNIPYNQQMNNFLDILEFKKQNKEKVILLIGNHDYHYTKEAMSRGEYYSGFQSGVSFQIQYCLMEALKEDLLQLCYIQDKFLFSHAGITKTWLKNTGYIGGDPLEIFINGLFKYQPLNFAFTKGSNYSPYGDDICQTPIWVRPKSLQNDRIDYYTQVVGHTQQNNIVIKENIILIDYIENSQYLIIEDGEAKVGKYDKD